jgi:hypothetical protein
LGAAGSENRIDKRRHGGTLGEDYQPAEQQQHNKNRQKPEFFANPQEFPEFFKKAHFVIKSG